MNYHKPTPTILDHIKLAVSWPWMFHKLVAIHTSVLKVPNSYTFISREDYDTYLCQKKEKDFYNKLLWDSLSAPKDAYKERLEYFQNRIKNNHVKIKYYCIYDGGCMSILR